MSYRILAISIVAIGMAGLAADLRAAETGGRTGVELSFDILDPSPTVAIRAQKHNDFVTAILLNEAILKREPLDRQALKRMVECHEALAKQDRQEISAVSQRPKTAEEDGFQDLPNLARQNFDTRQLAQDPGRHPF